MVFCGVALAGCEGALSTLDPAGPHAASVAGLWWSMFGGALMLAALVWALLLLAFRRRGAERPASRRLWIVGLGLVLPGVVLSSLLLVALKVGSGTLPRGEALRIEAQASRWTWTFVYPDGQASEGVLHLPAGRAVDLGITATDVIHSLWIPRLAGKLDAIPGKANVLRLIASEPGRMQGTCAEYCGPGHAGHGFEVVVHDAADWAAWLAEERP
ncbi:MAG TPA: cytochrome c oxidase subunit II [Burkholderiaceae bacterium]|nr:cytochrome c oxidase subunit II [Burkholderiaceae bacterium]